jgi:quercetin dioxygenase-like cupin family protein
MYAGKLASYNSVRAWSMFSKKSGDGYRSTIKGVEHKTLVYGRHTSMVEFRMRKGSRIPTHHHHHEQAGYLLSGRIRMFIGDDVYDCRPGDSWCVTGDDKHGIYAVKDSVFVNVFSPVREEFHPDTEYAPFIQSWNR